MTKLIEDDQKKLKGLFKPKLFSKLNRSVEADNHTS